MKVLEINSFFNMGGPPRIVNDVCDTLMSRGDDCMVAASRADMRKDVKSVRIGGKFSPYVNAISARLFDNDGFTAKRATKKLIKEIEAYNPDVIHLHNLHGYYINVEILFKYLKSANKKVVWTLHDCWAFTGHCAHFDYAECFKWESGDCANCPQKKEYPKSVFLSRSKQNFVRKKNAFTGVKDLTIVTPSNWLKSLVERSFLKEYKVVNIYNGIDLDKFKPIKSDVLMRYGLENKKILLGVANVWSSRKGFKDFIKLAEVLPSDYKIVLIGLNEKQIKTLPTNVFGLRRTGSIQELCEWYTAADKFINLTYEETMGLVTAEALACGKTVIVYDRTAVPEVIDVSCGMVVRAGDIDGVLNAVNKENFLSDDCIRRAKEFEKNIKYQEYLELFNRKK